MCSLSGLRAFEVWLRGVQFEVLQGCCSSRTSYAVLFFQLVLIQYIPYNTLYNPYTIVVSILLSIIPIEPHYILLFCASSCQGDMLRDGAVSSEVP